MTRTVIFEGSFARIVKVDSGGPNAVPQFVVETQDGRDGIGAIRWTTTIRPERFQDVLADVAAELDKEQSRVNAAVKVTQKKK